MALSITTSEENGGVFVEVEGEIDVSNAAELRSALDEAIKCAVYDIEIDFSKVSYIDSTGIGVLVGFSHRANAARIAFRISNIFCPSPRRSSCFSFSHASSSAM